MGLRRGGFALADRKVKIDRAHIQPDTGPTFDGDPKANSGRTVSLPAFLVPEVESHLAEFVGSAPDAYVFLGSKGEVPARHVATFTTIWDKARQQAGGPAASSVESARGAVPVLPPARFPGPLAEPAVPISR